jgi:K(+)-stimulated pyrophosphate-energized sodium pump
VGILAYVVLCVFSELVASRKLPFVVSLADKCRKGPAAAVTLGLAFGYIASFAPAIIISLVTFYGYQFLGFYGIALSILGFISTFPIQIALQCLAPIASDAATSSRIASLGDEEKEVTAHLSRAGESTAIVSRGAMIGSSPLIGIILFGGFLRNASLDSESAETGISLTDPQIFTGLMIGGVLPFILSGLAVKGSRKAISPLVKEI